MKVGDIVIVSSLGEMKVYKANPRDLEAEAGLKPDHIKLDLINSLDYVELHWRIQDIVTDMTGRFKSNSEKMGANSGEKHELENKIEEDVIKAIAQDIAEIVAENNPPKYFLALPQNVFKRVWSYVEALSSKYPGVTEKLFRYVEEDLTKEDKNKLPEIFKEKGKHF